MRISLVLPMIALLGCLALRRQSMQLEVTDPLSRFRFARTPEPDAFEQVVTDQYFIRWRPGFQFLKWCVPRTRSTPAFATP